MSVATICHIEQLAENLPKPQRGLSEPRFDFLRNVQVSPLVQRAVPGASTALLRCIAPMPMATLIAMREAVPSLSDLWPNTAHRIKAVLSNYTPDRCVDYQEMPPETEDGPLGVWVTVIVPVPQQLLSSAETAAKIIPMLDEAITIHVREYQVAQRLQ